MATASLSSLGIGSNGALSYDVIDKLRAADESAELNPIDTKLTTNKTQQTDLSTITSLASTLKSSVSSLADDISYLQRTTSVSDESAVSVTADAGTNLQNFSLHVDTLAKQDIYQSTSFASQTSTFASANDTLTLTMNGQDYNFSVTTATTLTDLKDMINNKLNGKVTASLLNTGGTDPYRLIIKSNDTGVDNQIKITSGTPSTLTSLGLDSTDNHLQTATDASFTYNGINISRSSNTISDLQNGVSITLKEAQKTTDPAVSVSIKQDWTDVKDQLTSLVSSYNDLMSNLTTATKYDNTTSTAGVFQGVSQLNQLSTDVRKQILSVDTKGRSLVDFGISLNDAGNLEFDATAFDTLTSSDPQSIKDYFSGATTTAVTTYTGSSSVPSGALNFAYGDLTINDTSIRFTTSASATAEENVLSLQQAINAANISGVTATVGENNTIMLKSTTGDNISIAGTTASLSSIGLKASTTYGNSTTTDGVFSTFNTLLSEYLDKSTGVLSLYTDALTTEKDSLTKQRASLVDQLDTKYTAMAKRFAAYDNIINKMTTSFQSVTYMIDAASKNNN